MFEIVRYCSERKNEWNQYVQNAKNASFLFLRDYMEYHSDRFEDYSLMFYRKGKLYALLPGNAQGEVFYSHQGLTYGGLIMNSKVTVSDTVELFNEMNGYLKEQSFKKVVYKAVPWIYHVQPSQEDIYAIFRSCDARIIGCNIGSTVVENNRIKFIESRKSGIRKAVANGITYRESDDYASFWDILDTNLKNKYGAKPVHTLEEIELLRTRFPNNIKLYLSYKDEKPLGGTVLYLSKQVVHTQYISASLEGKEEGSLDILFDYLVNQEYVNYKYFDFGPSTEDMGHGLNESLIFQKEGFGGRGMVSEIYEWNL